MNPQSAPLTKCKAHRNLNAPGGAVEWSLTPLAGGHKGRVLGYARWLLLSDVFFRVQPTGVQRIRERGVRAVVAWAEGALTELELVRYRYPDHDYAIPQATDTPDAKAWVQVRFDPFSGATAFTRADNGEPVRHADQVLLAPSGACYALRVTAD